MTNQHGAPATPKKGKVRPDRKLHRGHFAFMRALAQGLDERASWDRLTSTVQLIFAGRGES